MSNKEEKAVRSGDVLDAIRKAYRAGVVTDDVLYEADSYYDGIREKVRAALSAVPDALVLYDRPPEGRLHWAEGADPSEDTPQWAEEAASYDLLFLAPPHEQLRFEGELEEEEFAEDSDEVVMVKRPTEGRIGCAAGISLVAPFAAIRFTEMETSESGSQTLPDITPHVFSLDGTELDLDAHYEEWLLEDGITPLRNLRAAITQALAAFGIRVLSEPELKTRIPELKPNPALNPDWEKPATVEQALFFVTFG